MLSGELELDAQGQYLSIGVELLGQEFGAKLNESYPQGTATLTLGLHTFLLRGRDYLIYKGPYPHKFRPRKPCFSTAPSHYISTDNMSMNKAPFSENLAELMNSATVPYVSLQRMEFLAKYLIGANLGSSSSLSRGGQSGL
ncbi:uncharacterized protein LOC127833840 [Dreissena polymorpha]|uniref:Uncharacterized protein n=1 Tax=Dreissena polymorpha TaxID=45954 RepID=A0A9D4G027_DREPO|nr:uncharacterized protein LOC127833840 [Dreissena polymorpha]KAH3806306.1 hypothetical protein DPMN_134625 [Dreissena polymorpha]